MQAVPIGAPTVVEIEEQQRAAASQAEARKARLAKDPGEDEKENVPRPRDRIPRSQAGPQPRQPVRLLSCTLQGFSGSSAVQFLFQSIDV
jgi:hypothetical protein